ncbi:bifunctional phosphoribosylaminoimidazolecarboxamide formyltransferase/IMP cyclohydrolase [Alkalibacter saccharofermentans]|uniref:Bifunctional purine biosynthesis protein PurH n=1 Tax=Alkalibacter saccharofermentans DSM 14828 TaxID=1120975 RepID=A0A1M4YDS0_9FIRM|nr:bifunctional phosphoribosylaminoimidazolecarboxamide formyltransferase/IMP cyclohydrolase [Alkalibacter saccharofermentans]SHF03917.1 phosphoribosylaminoimidazolecarboxamide formyltransferase / IMP cyclohydrolase [Alkalibacter saccharofermentans DSM 14828]
MRALISVSDKSGVLEFAKTLEDLGVEIISTGGTARLLEENKIKVTGISDVTGFPECLDGRVKTLHPGIHGGILAMRDNPAHMEKLQELNIQPIDIVAVNLYPFKETISKEGVSLEEAVENIDIGGPTMIRAAAKNYKDVAVITDPVDYKTVIDQLKDKGSVDVDVKYDLALKVFQHTANYDAMISAYLKEQAGKETMDETLTVTFEKVQDLRYGENPHQKAAFYKEVGKQSGTLVDAVQLHGKELSYNNINDTNGALEALKEFYGTPTVVAVKHANPCGVGSADSIYEAFIKAYEGDPVSIFGGIVVANGEIDKKTAEKINELFIEVLVAPSYSEEALEVLTRKKNIRILKLEGIEKRYQGYELKKVMGGILLQDTDSVLLGEDLKVVTKRQPTKEEMEDLIFAWKVVKNTKSNGISLAKDKMLIANGPGQVSRIWALQNAIRQGGESLIGSVLASDAFFPFEDSVEAANKAGVTAIIQPGGSIRDEDSIKLCDKYGIAMVFTGMRHFKH